MALLTDEIRDDCEIIPAELVTKWDFAIESNGDKGHAVKDVRLTEIEFCDGTVVDKDTVAYTFYQNPSHMQKRFANKA